MSHAIASEIPDAETNIAPSLKHMGLVERPELFTIALLEFLDRFQPQNSVDNQQSINHSL